MFNLSKSKISFYLILITILITVMLFAISSSTLAADLYGRDLLWNPGLESGIPERAIEANVMDFGALGDGVSNDYAAFRAAIDSLENGGVVFIPEGEYLINDSLRIDDSVVLRGEGVDKTRLLINHSSNAFDVIKYRRGTWHNLEGGYEKGSRELYLKDTSDFEIGVYVEIQQDNDPDIMYTLSQWNTGWAQGAMGQIARVASIDGNKIVLDEPLRLNYDSQFNPIIRTQGFVEYVGFENFTIERIDTSPTYIFYFKNAANSWVKNVHSKFASKGHVYANTVYRLEVRDSFFDDATNWGSGGHGYGVELGYHTTNSLVENNIFRRLRHSMMVHLGANANVFGYNYSIEPKSDGDWMPSDISLHGHYAYHNLFEGNIVQRVVVSDFWGPSGPNNTIIRNRVESEGISIQDSSNYQNIIANELVQDIIDWDTDNRFPHLIDPDTLLIHGNYVQGEIQWDDNIEDHSLPVSLYHDSKPEFYAAMDWPSTGADILNGSNPARERFLGNDISDKEFMLGDVNGDGLIDSRDITILSRYLLSMLDLDEASQRAADLNGDGMINASDLSLLIRYIQGMIDEFPSTI
ncbi:dockerin type I domain-containing protein [Natronospora cellulosivora (SeqCode)]